MISPTQREWIERISVHGSVRVEEIPALTFRALNRQGMLEEVPRLYFGPRAHAVRLSLKGKKELEKMSSKRFRNLPPAQADAFEQICINNDRGHAPATLKALVKKGLIEETRVTQGAFSHFRYSVPIPIHVEWCEWCSKQVESEDGSDSFSPSASE